MILRGENMVKVNFEGENAFEFDEDKFILTVKSPTTLRQIHSGIVNYGDYPYSICIDNVDFEIQEVYSDALILVEKCNESERYLYRVKENICNKLG